VPLHQGITRRTFGGMPLIMGINKIYKKSTTVKRPDNADAPTNGLLVDGGVSE
jgi:hypothetical protein